MSEEARLGSHQSAAEVAAMVPMQQRLLDIATAPHLPLDPPLTFEMPDTVCTCVPEEAFIPASGLTWMRVNKPQDPMRCPSLTNAPLSEALKARLAFPLPTKKATTFTPAEWVAFGVTEPLTTGHFVQLDNRNFFQPVEKLPGTSEYGRKVCRVSDHVWYSGAIEGFKCHHCALPIATAVADRKELTKPQIRYKNQGTGSAIAYDALDLHAENSKAGKIFHQCRHAKCIPNQKKVAPFCASGADGWALHFPATNTGEYRFLWHDADIGKGDGSFGSGGNIVKKFCPPDELPAAPLGDFEVADFLRDFEEAVQDSVDPAFQQAAAQAGAAAQASASSATPSAQGEEGEGGVLRSLSGPNYRSLGGGACDKARTCIESEASDEETDEEGEEGAPAYRSMGLSAVAADASWKRADKAMMQLSGAFDRIDELLEHARTAREELPPAQAAPVRMAVRANIRAILAPLMAAQKRAQE